ncbi:MAG: hypothetical protein PHH86_05405, partial [Sphaerochaetaceae bacterium]|nr:hypothetical protein [Sphaerochaetaceae bacterium]
PRALQLSTSEKYSALTRAPRGVMQNRKFFRSRANGLMQFSAINTKLRISGGECDQTICSGTKSLAV